MRRRLAEWLIRLAIRVGPKGFIRRDADPAATPPPWAWLAGGLQTRWPDGMARLTETGLDRPPDGKGRDRYWRHDDPFYDGFRP